MYMVINLTLYLHGSLHGEKIGDLGGEGGGQFPVALSPHQLLPLRHVEGTVANGRGNAVDAGTTRGGGGELGEDLNSGATGRLRTENFGKFLGAFVSHKVVTNLEDGVMIRRGKLL